MNISRWKIGDRTFFSLEVDDRLLLVGASVITTEDALVDGHLAAPGLAITRHSHSGLSRGQNEAQINFSEHKKCNVCKLQ